jgi:hypothetical protein
MRILGPIVQTLVGSVFRMACPFSSNNLAVPENIAILPLPPKSPELNPVENIWQFMRDNCSPTASSSPMRISSTAAARLGEHCRSGHGRSCQSADENGRKGSDH